MRCVRWLAVFLPLVLGACAVASAPAPVSPAPMSPPTTTTGPSSGRAAITIGCSTVEVEFTGFPDVPNHAVRRCVLHPGPQRHSRRSWTGSAYDFTFTYERIWPTVTLGVIWPGGSATASAGFMPGACP